MLKVEKLSGYKFPVFEISGNLDVLGVKTFEENLSRAYKDQTAMILNMKETIVESP